MCNDFAEEIRSSGMSVQEARDRYASQKIQYLTILNKSLEQLVEMLIAENRRNQAEERAVR